MLILLLSICLLAFTHTVIFWLGWECGRDWLMRKAAEATLSHEEGSWAGLGEGLLVHPEEWEG